MANVALGRRQLLLGAAGAGACARSEPADGFRREIEFEAAALAASPSVRVLEWDFGQQPWGRAKASVVVPSGGASETRYPVLIALHGRGEALKPAAEGALGWPRDYALVRAMERLRAPPLLSADYEGLVSSGHLSAVNAALLARPYQGLIVVCPWLPDVRPASTGDIAACARYILGALLPRVRSETPALRRPETTGIDGVSLGGVLALRIGLTCADSFGSVGGIQAALSEGQEAEWTALAQSARARRPGLRLRLVTSYDDYFRRPVLALSHALDAAGIAHDFADGPGPHDYIFNRGPGSIELLMWHDGALGRT